ncbi:MAG: lipoyl(octanoyl) transferase LipB [Thiotrichales bacterium]
MAPDVRRPPKVSVVTLGRRDYIEVWQAMQMFTDGRTPTSPDQLWVVEHDPVFTLGQASRPEHLIAPADIPVVATDRGGQVTYHGPGQIVVYTLVDLARRRLGVRALVSLIEGALIELLGQYGIDSHARADAPGVYVGAAKIAALGLRVRHGRSYHGLSLNVALDLEPFTRIDPCGHRGLEVTRLLDLGIGADFDTVAADLCSILMRRLDESFIGGSTQHE